jgi:hypothetical protein
VDGSGVVSMGKHFTNQQFSFPAVRSIADKQILQSDASGVLGWVDHDLRTAYANTPSPQIITSEEEKTFVIREGAAAIDQSVLRVEDASAVQLLEVNGTSGVTISSDLRYQKGVFEMYADNNVAITTCATKDVDYLIAMTTPVDGVSVGFDIDTTINKGRITYLGSRTRLIHCGASVSFKSASPNVVCTVSIYKNGVYVPGSEVKRKIANQDDIGSSALHKILTMSTNDYIEMHVECDTANTSITFEDLNIFGMALPNVVV